MTKNLKPKKRRNMTLELSCKRAGVPVTALKVEWSEPEDKALVTFTYFQQVLEVLLRSHGLLGGLPKKE